jgi:Leucine-rich repeat (LRR) protein
LTLDDSSFVYRLEYLNLSGNLLNEIYFPVVTVGYSNVEKVLITSNEEDEKETLYFPNLTRLNLSENCISDVSGKNTILELIANINFIRN